MVKGHSAFLSDVEESFELAVLKIVFHKQLLKEKEIQNTLKP